MLLAIEWEQGECPSAPRLVSHVLDRLEYVCAWDLVEEAGEAGQWLSGRVEACDWLPHMRVLTRGGGADVGRGGGDRLGFTHFARKKAKFCVLSKILVEFCVLP